MDVGSRVAFANLSFTNLLAGFGHGYVYDGCTARQHTKKKNRLRKLTVNDLPFLLWPHRLPA